MLGKLYILPKEIRDQNLSPTPCDSQPQRVFSGCLELRVMWRFRTVSPRMMRMIPGWFLPVDTPNMRGEWKKAWKVPIEVS